MDLNTAINDLKSFSVDLKNQAAGIKNNETSLLTRASAVDLAVSQLQGVLATQIQDITPEQLLTFPAGRALISERDAQAELVVEKTLKIEELSTRIEQLITLDKEAPVIIDFIIPDQSDSLTIPILSLKASDNIGVSGYLISEDGAIPSLTDPRWTKDIPKDFTFTILILPGVKTLSAFVKDEAGNISFPVKKDVTVTIS